MSAFAIELREENAKKIVEMEDVSDQTIASMIRYQLQTGEVKYFVWDFSDGHGDPKVMNQEKLDSYFSYDAEEIKTRIVRLVRK